MSETIEEEYTRYYINNTIEPINILRRKGIISSEDCDEIITKISNAITTHQMGLKENKNK